jgi:hypothetical protein
MGKWITEAGLCFGVLLKGFQVYEDLINQIHLCNPTLKILPIL